VMILKIKNIILIYFWAKILWKTTITTLISMTRRLKKKRNLLLYRAFFQQQMKLNS
jgi:F420-0:gamma-glutamyl ligase-like protein